MKKRLLLKDSVVTINDDYSTHAETINYPYALCDRVFLVREDGVYTHNGKDYECKAGNILLLHETDDRANHSDQNIDYNVIVIDNKELSELVDTKIKSYK